MNKFDELTKSMAQSATRRGALKTAGLACITVLGISSALAFFGSTSGLAASPGSPAESVIIDPAGDAVFPYNYFDGPVPPYMDVVEASVTLKRGVFHFEMKMNSEIPANPDPGLTPGVNHFGPTFGILTDRASFRGQSPYKFFGQTDVYRFNYLVGTSCFIEDGGLGLGLGWTGFMRGPDGVFVALPITLRGDTLIVEVPAASLDYPTSFQWVVGSECTPVPDPEESTRTLIFVDFVPDHGYANWSSQ